MPPAVHRWEASAQTCVRQNSHTQEGVSQMLWRQPGGQNLGLFLMSCGGCESEAPHGCAKPSARHSMHLYPPISLTLLRRCGRGRERHRRPTMSHRWGHARGVCARLLYVLLVCSCHAAFAHSHTPIQGDIRGRARRGRACYFESGGAAVAPAYARRLLTPRYSTIS